MSAMTTDRNTQRRDGVQFAFPVAGATLIPLGIMVQLAAGLAVNAVSTAANVTVGVSEQCADNSDGSDGDIVVPIRKGCYRFNNSASADLITLAQVGSNCYVVDNQTVAKTNNSGARPVAGLIVDVDAVGVWVKF